MKGWRITGAVFVAISLFIAITLLVAGISEESIRLIVRSTARISVSIFLLAFSASSLHALFRKRWTAYLLGNRRYIGVGFAVAHTFHLISLITLARYYPTPFRDDLTMVTVVGGGLAYVLMFLMAATSFDRTRRLLGEKRWKVLHTTGAWYLWLVFAQTYYPAVSHNMYFLPFALALTAALLLRLLAMRRAKTQTRAFSARPQ